jgi:tRNA threonylcarbamoyladenosine biosynthesis protein TsaB
MYIVAIETSTDQASVAVGTAAGIVAEARLVRPRRHAEFCLPALDFCLSEAGIGVEQVAGVAVGLGPGLFTGIRVGIATARGLAMARRLPVCGFASLDVLAFAARFTRRTIVPVVDARRREVYWGLYRSVPGGVQRLGEHRLDTPEEVAAELAAHDHDVLLVGDGAHTYRSVFDERGIAEYGDSDHRYPSAAALVELAVPKFEREEFCRPQDLAAIYLRRPDAAINWQVR